MTAVVDASVLVSILSATDAHHAGALKWLRERQRAGDSIVVPASALAEVLVGAHRRGAAQVAHVEKIVERRLVTLVPPDDRIAREAARLRAEQPALALPDAFVIATGRVLGTDMIATVDSRWPRYDPKITVIT